MKTRFTCSMLLIASLVLLSLGVTASPGWAQDSTTTTKKKKKKQQTSSESSELSQVLSQVDKRILGYDTVKARELLEPVMGDSSPKVEMALGRILMLEQKYDDAATKLMAASRKSGDLYALLYLGDTYSYAKKSAEADQTYQQLSSQAQAKLTSKPGDADALYCLGAAQLKLKQYDLALQNLAQARAAKPKNELVPYQMGVAHLLKNEFQPAVDQLSAALEMNSTLAYAYYYRALAADKVNRKDLLVNDLDRFLALAPNAPEAAKAQQILKAIRG